MKLMVNVAILIEVTVIDEHQSVENQDCATLMVYFFVLFVESQDYNGIHTLSLY